MTCYFVEHFGISIEEENSGLSLVMADTIVLFTLCVKNPTFVYGGSVFSGLACIFYSSNCDICGLTFLKRSIVMVWYVT